MISVITASSISSIDHYNFPLFLITLDFMMVSGLWTQASLVIISFLSPFLKQDKREMRKASKETECTIFQAGWEVPSVNMWNIWKWHPPIKGMYPPITTTCWPIIKDNQPTCTREDTSKSFLKSLCQNKCKFLLQNSVQRRTMIYLEWYWGQKKLVKTEQQQDGKWEAKN